jgi:hypothetical protein
LKVDSHVTANLDLARVLVVIRFIGAHDHKLFGLTLLPLSLPKPLLNATRPDYDVSF